MITLDDFRASHPMAQKHARIVLFHRDGHPFNRIYTEPLPDAYGLLELSTLTVCVPMISPYKTWFQVSLPRKFPLHYCSKSITGGRDVTEGPMGVLVRKRWDQSARKPYLSLDKTVYFLEEPDAVTFGLYLGEFTRDHFSRS